MVYNGIVYIWPNNTVVGNQHGKYFIFSRVGTSFLIPKSTTVSCFHIFCMKLKEKNIYNTIIPFSSAYMQKVKCRVWFIPLGTLCVQGLYQRNVHDPQQNIYTHRILLFIGWLHVNHGSVYRI